jgi:hypothetical protein
MWLCAIKIAKEKEGDSEREEHAKKFLETQSICCKQIQSEKKAMHQ